MRKVFEFEEKLTYLHSIEVNIEEGKEEEYEDFTNSINNINDDKSQIIDAFKYEFGKDNVDFVEDGSPSVEYECY